MGTLSQMINPVLVRLGGEDERKGVLGGCLLGEHSHYKGQRQTVMLSHQPQIPLSLALSGFCFSCQENWQAAGMKKSGSSWASFQLRGHAQELKKKRVLPLDKTSRGEKMWKNRRVIFRSVFTAVNILFLSKKFWLYWKPHLSTHSRIRNIERWLVGTD